MFATLSHAYISVDNHVTVCDAPSARPVWLARSNGSDMEGATPGKLETTDSHNSSAEHGIAGSIKSQAHSTITDKVARVNHTEPCPLTPFCGLGGAQSRPPFDGDIPRTTHGCRL